MSEQCARSFAFEERDVNMQVHLAGISKISDSVACTYPFHVRRWNATYCLHCLNLFYLFANKHIKHP